MSMMTTMIRCDNDAYNDDDNDTVVMMMTIYDFNAVICIGVYVLVSNFDHM